VIWQDAVISITVLIFALTIIPMIKARTVVPLWTAVPMVVGAIALTIAYITLGLWLSVAVEAASAVLWAVVLRRSIHAHAQ
jgi:hypothetical protein